MDKIAILYQATLPPAKDGIQKPMKPGGYSDSGADIAYELSKNKINIATSVSKPAILNDFDWVFPDTKIGIKQALERGAGIFWLNTVLYKSHPIEELFDGGYKFVGQTPEAVDLYDDKLYVHELLTASGIPMPKTQLIRADKLNNVSLHIRYPLVVKPIRGRGSQGVILVENNKELEEYLHTIFSEKKYGAAVYIEEYLSGQEITITVMPAGSYTIQNSIKHFKKPWCLPAIKRFNHINGITPYNGLIAVMENSKALTNTELDSKPVMDAYSHCSKAAEILGLKAPIRIDCRANYEGDYYLFDVNMKPNMTGPSRPQRKNQDSLTLLAAREIGWSYFDLLNNILNQNWKMND